MTTIAPIFEEALGKVFDNWTLIALAIDQGWGGRDSRAKRQQLQVEVYERLAEGARRKRPPSHQNEDDVIEFADFLCNRVLTFFYAEIDDGSDEEVARVCLRLFNTCHGGDVTFAQEFMQRCQAADLQKCQGIESIEYATEEDQLVAGIEGMEIEMGQDDGEGSDDSMDESGDDGEPSGKGKGYDGGAQPVAAAPVVETEVVPQKNQEQEEPAVDEDGFTSVVKGNRKMKNKCM